MTVSWSTAEAVSDAVAARAAVGGEWSAPIAADDRVVRSLGQPASATEYHHVALTDLTPGERYEYALGRPIRRALLVARSRPHRHRSAPFAFTAFGDQGHRRHHQRHPTVVDDRRHRSERRPPSTSTSATSATPTVPAWVTTTASPTS